MSKDISVDDKKHPEFDDYIVGRHVKVMYTHHDIAKPDGSIGDPLFLCFDEHGDSLPQYIAGEANARSWIKTVDLNIDRKLQQ